MTTSVTLNAVFVAAKAQGKSTTVVIDAIKACKLDWSNAKAVGEVADSYKAGRVVASLNLKSESQAMAIMALKPHKDGAGDGHRTLSQHMACRAAISAWSTIRLLAGAPSSQDGTKRKARAARATKVAEKDKAKSELPDALLPALTRATSVQDVHAYALRMAQNVKRYLALNAAFVQGDVGDVLRHFPTDVAKAVKAKPVEVAKAIKAKPVEVAKAA